MKLELKFFKNFKKIFFIDFALVYKREILKSLNLIFSQLHSVNNISDELVRLNIIRLYLIRTFSGKSHALGRPVRGQRT